ncbi:MORN repeat-containing protein 3-like [Frankliniella occidentalis]|uniref:MORN repeat-containing protein 3 n=1 Tax=Frankliniella occidentalis TaxID=133901 RepID=A0A6J1S9C9_FRAOC|nr:MORN repeat-containing protein 3-like [Frankliniella occidentalis]
MPFLKKFKACPEWKRKEQITYKSGSRHTVYFLNGDRHVGDWLNNRKEGKGAELTRNGYLYEGDFSDELRHGHGVLSKQMEDGSLRLVYSGEWQRGKRHGWGIGRGADGTWYEGCWQAGRRAGEGRVWLPDGAFYHGEWMDDKFHGHGILVQPNGNCFDGEFHGGLKHGRGCYYHKDSGHVQEGVWDEDVCVSSTMQPSSPAASTKTLPPNELLNPDAVAEESQKGALQKIRSKSAQNNGSTT